MSIYAQVAIDARIQRRKREREPVWWQALPAGWRAMVVSPLRFEVCSEYEIDADRTTGFDESDLPCYCAYRYVLTETRLDEDDMFFEEPVYMEHCVAWRLRDERWLVYRSVFGSGDGDCPHAFFSFSDSMPR